MASTERNRFQDPQGLTQRSLVIAHRGATSRAPENTLEAFHLAVDLGADGVELDVHESRDGHFVVHHDPDLPRGLIANLPFDRIRGLPAKHGGDVPALMDVLAMLAERRPGYVVCVEVKGMRSWQKLRRELAPWRDALHLEIQSFELDLLREIDADADGHRLGVITQAPATVTVSLLDELGAVGLSVRENQITAELVETLHAAERRLYAWTVNDAERARELAALGVDAIISDVPEALHPLA